jgi:hypothetical protein
MIGLSQQVTEGNSCVLISREVRSTKIYVIFVIGEKWGARVFKIKKRGQSGRAFEIRERYFAGCCGVSTFKT